MFQGHSMKLCKRGYVAAITSWTLKLKEDCSRKTINNLKLGTSNEFTIPRGVALSGTAIVEYDLSTVIIEPQGATLSGTATVEDNTIIALFTSSAEEITTSSGGILYVRPIKTLYTSSWEELKISSGDVLYIRSVAYDYLHASDGEAFITSSGDIIKIIG